MFHDISTHVDFFLMPNYVIYGLEIVLFLNEFLELICLLPVIWLQLLLILIVLVIINHLFAHS